MKMSAHKLSPSVRRPDCIITPTLRVIDFLCEHARADEIVQYEALTGREYNHEEAAVAFWSSGPFRVAVAGPDNVPIAAGGYEQIMPGVMQSWMVGTQEGWDKHYRRIHQGTRWLLDTLADSGKFRRFQTSGLTSRAHACAWYERLGMQFEGIQRGVGANGEDVSMYARVITMEEAL